MASLPPDRLKDVPLHEIGDQILELIPMLTKGEVKVPIVFIAVGDGDTGELISTGNLEGSQIVDLLKLLLSAHETGSYDVQEDAKPDEPDEPKETLQ